MPHHRRAARNLQEIRNYLDQVRDRENTR